MSAASPRPLAWYFYAGIVLSIGIARFVERSLLDSGGVASRYGPLLAATIIVYAVFCWLRNVQRPGPLFWRCVGALFMLAQLAGWVFATYLVMLGILLPAGSLALLLLLLLPGVSRMYLLGRRHGD